jgi:tetratricopeptide (TPR) repeat protein
LAEIYYFANDKPMILFCGLRALYLSERAGPSPALAQAYGNLVLICGLLRRHRLAEIYSKLALETAEIAGDIPALAWVLLLDGTYRIGLGQWDETREKADRALIYARQVDDKRVVGLILALRSLLPFHLGQFEEAGNWCWQWHETGSEIDTTQHQTAGLMGMAENLLRLEQPEAALRLLEQAFDIWTEKANREELDMLGRFRGFVTMALTRLRLGEYRLARQAVGQAMELLPYVSSPNRITMLETVGNFAYVCLLLWAKEPPDEALISAANTACDLIEKYARVFPIMGPKANILLGMREWLLQRPTYANDYWQKGLALAEQFGMPYEQAMAHVEIGKNTADPALRQEHLQKAQELFDEMGIALNTSN